ncbi:P-II family nitrogen regulator [Natranaerofaba carboxydovora]|uniref:P-II family nitrogen regulator n=1 Tax=Natranaerofaba carboxydovora TaxID=2742683 RepID=UPI001F142427|nr:P-II family nitrogen regulator [Natranaerofaba carboxydovora]UMZ75023.1 hypothetical protein ACONDI_02631 [Natranaerofaba carboxydovora]
MHLLVIIIRDKSKLTPVLDKLFEVDVRGATVIESQGMGHLIADHVPFFSRFAEIVNKNEQGSKTIFSVVKDKDILDNAILEIEKICGNLEDPNTGFLFTIPVDYAKGFPAQQPDKKFNRK